MLTRAPMQRQVCENLILGRSNVRFPLRDLGHTHDDASLSRMGPPDQLSRGGRPPVSPVAPRTGLSMAPVRTQGPVPLPRSGWRGPRAARGTPALRRRPIPPGRRTRCGCAERTGRRHRGLFAVLRARWRGVRVANAWPARSRRPCAEAGSWSLRRSSDGTRCSSSSWVMLASDSVRCTLATWIWP